MPVTGIAPITIATFTSTWNPSAAATPMTRNIRAKDRAGTFLVMGVAAALGFHVLVNVAMVIGAMPVTGIPLPLMSYGGSATLFVFLAIGLVMNVRLRRFVN